MKHIICTVGGVIGGILATLFGGWSDGLLVLVVMMAIDYASGLIVAGVFHRSPKSPGGGLESKACLKGIMRKIFVLALVSVGHLIDRLIGTSYVRDAACIAFILYELISIMENAGLMGIPIPKIFYRALDVLRSKAGEDEKQEDSAKEQAGENTGAASSDGAAGAETFASRGRLNAGLQGKAKEKPPDGEETDASIPRDGRPVPYGAQKGRNSNGPAGLGMTTEENVKEEADNG